MRRQRGISARAFMAGFSSGSSGGFAPQELTADTDNQPKVIVSEHWDGHKWVATRLEWDGVQYRPGQASSGYRPWWLPSDIAYYTSSARDLAALGYTEHAARCARKVEELERKLAAWESEHGKLEAA
jgi:hypothetical protein